MISFPLTPAINQSHIATNGITYVWDGTRWTGKSGATSSALPADAGQSAYQVALANGFIGTEAQWLLSLKGAKGDVGDIGPIGNTGLQGIQGVAGTNGTNANIGTGYGIGNLQYGTPVNVGGDLIGLTGGINGSGQWIPTDLGPNYAIGIGIAATGTWICIATRPAAYSDLPEKHTLLRIA